MAIPDRNKCCINRIVYNSIVHIPPDVNPPEDVSNFYGEFTTFDPADIETMILRKVTIDGVDYDLPIGVGTGFAMHNGISYENYSSLNTLFDAVPAAAGIQYAFFSFDYLSDYKVKLNLAGTISTASFTFDSISGNNQVITLNNIGPYSESCYQVVFDIGGDTVAQITNFNSATFSTEFLFDYSGAPYLDEPGYDAKLLPFAYGLCGQNVSISISLNGTIVTLNVDNSAINLTQIAWVENGSTVHPINTTLC